MIKLPKVGDVTEWMDLQKVIPKLYEVKEKDAKKAKKAQKIISEMAEECAGVRVRVRFISAEDQAKLQDLVQNASQIEASAAALDLAIADVDGFDIGGAKYPDPEYLGALMAHGYGHTLAMLARLWQQVSAKDRPSYFI